MFLNQIYPSKWGAPENAEVFRWESGNLPWSSPFIGGVFIGYILVKIMRCIRKKMSLLGTNTYPFPRFWDSFRRWFSSFYLWVGYGFPRSLEGKSHLFPWFRREKTIQTTPAMNPKPEKKTARKKWGPENKNPKSCVVWLPNRQEPSVEGSNHLKSHLK